MSKQQEHTIVLTEEDLALLLSTFKAREIRVKEWIAEAKKSGNAKQVKHWQWLLASKSGLVDRIRKQTEV